MNAAAIDVWTGLLIVGIIATFVSTVALIVGLAPARRATPVREPASVPALPLRSASSVRDQAAARAKAAAAADPATPATVPPSDRPTLPVHVLTDVHLVRPAGQEPPDGDVRVQEPIVTDAEANAIVAHFAEHDPARIAEVITQWIRSDDQHRRSGLL